VQTSGWTSKRKWWRSFLREESKNGGVSEALCAGEVVAVLGLRREREEEDDGEAEKE
jgi:hypothetical protein